MRTLFTFLIGSLLLFPAVASADYDVTHIYSYPTPHRLTSDLCLTQVFDIVDNPNGRTKRDFRDDPGMSNASQYTQLALRTQWRFDSGNYNHFDWATVSHQLKTQYEVHIGMATTCVVGGDICPIECFSFDADVFPRYVRDLYLIRDGAELAVVSVLTPTDGCSLAYTRCDVVNHTAECNGSSEPVSAVLTCGSTTVYPAVDDCSDPTNPDKRKFRDEPALNEPHRATTWGAIKALYD